MHVTRIRGSVPGRASEVFIEPARYADFPKIGKHSAQVNASAPFLMPSKASHRPIAEIEIAANHMSTDSGAGQAKTNE